MYYIGSMAYDPNYLEHHGVLGMKWGVRRYQNPDGSLTAKGKIRYYQTEKGDYKKRKILSRGFEEGVSRMTKRNGEPRSLRRAMQRNNAMFAAKTVAADVLTTTAIVASLGSSPIYVPIVAFGASVATAIVNGREGARLLGANAGSIAEWKRRTGE